MFFTNLKIGMRALSRLLPVVLSSRLEEPTKVSVHILAWEFQMGTLVS